MRHSTFPFLSSGINQPTVVVMPDAPITKCAFGWGMTVRGVARPVKCIPPQSAATQAQQSGGLPGAISADENTSHAHTKHRQHAYGMSVDPHNSCLTNAMFN